MIPKIEVLIVDDHPFFRQGIRFYLESLEDLQVAGEAASGHEAVTLLEKMKKQERLPVVLMDLNMPGMNGIDTIRALLDGMPCLRILVLTSSDDGGTVQQALSAGAAGYCRKDAPPQELATAIRAIYGGGTFLGRGVRTQLLTKKTEGETAEHLTQREKEVLHLITRGLSNKEIASELYVSEKTVKTHVANLFGKLSVTSRTQAALWAKDNGLE